MENMNQSVVQASSDNKNMTLAQRIRNFTGDYEKGNIHEVMRRNNLLVDYFTAKTRVRDLGWTDIEQILTTPKQSSRGAFTDKVETVAGILNGKIGEKLRTSDIVKATGLLAKHVSEIMNAVYDRYHGLQRTQTNRGYIFFVASKLEPKQKASPGDRGIEMNGIKFVKKARKASLNTESIGPNWFIAKRFH